MWVCSHPHEENREQERGTQSEVWRREKEVWVCTHLHEENREQERGDTVRGVEKGGGGVGMYTPT